MDFPNAMKEVDREDGFWAHLVRSEGRAYSWVRYEELADGKWSSKILDQGELNAYEVNKHAPSSFPWVTWIVRGTPNDLRFNLGSGCGGPHSFYARIQLQDGRRFNWNRVADAPGGQWTDLADGGELNAYESNDRVVSRLPRIVRLNPRSVPGEYMFNGGL